jgi:predicted nucleic acid-binding protein
MVIEKPVLIDTNIWIDALNGLPDALNVLNSYIDIALSAITYAEVASGCSAVESAVFEAFLQAGQAAGTVQIIHTDDAIIRLASTFNKNHDTGCGYGKRRLPDAIIGAAAVISGRILLTRNAPDFKYVVHETPYQGQWVDQEKDGKTVKTWLPASTPAANPPVAKGA